MTLGCNPLPRKALFCESPMLVTLYGRCLIANAAVNHRFFVRFHRNTGNSKALFQNEPFQRTKSKKVAYVE
jgi:hypothetical protein